MHRDMKEVQYYVLFPNHDNGMRLHRELKTLGVKAASKCCGISLLIKEEDVETVRQCVREHGIEILDITAIEKDVNPNRDRYC